ncbi:MAG: carbohydrate porin [Thermodesulfovibrionaceae bacterium]
MKKYVVFFLILFFPLLASAVEITEKLSISGTATTVYQWLNKARGDVSNKDRGSAVLDFNVSFRPIENGEFFVRLSFAKGDGLKGVNPFLLSPNADDLFSDLKNINGHSRDHLLEFWYAHKFELKKDISIKLTAGLIDSTAFIDDNNYAADELTQFMNEVLVHNPLANLPSYDSGLAAEFEWDRFHLRVVGMRSKNEIEKSYNWIGAQIGYKLETVIGEGNYRVYAYTTNKRFEGWETDTYKALRGIGVSFDQQLIKDTVGAFLRMGWQDDSAQVDYNRMFSLGLNFNGGIWGRKNDEIAVGYAYLKTPSKNEELKYTQVFEGYIKFQLFSYKFLSSDITFDYQYIYDKTRNPENTKAGHIYTVRLNFHF